MIGERKMDNNFNQQAPQQPMYQQAPQQQMPQQQMYQQPMYQQPVYQPVPKAPKNMKELLAFILAASAALLAILGATFTCSCSATKSMKKPYSLHPIFIIAIIAAIVGAVAVVFAIMALKDKNATVKAGKLSYLAIAIGGFAVVYALLPVFTICGYNCSLENAQEKAAKDALKDLGNMFGGF
jgi:Ni/Fe-hydrogenase subunit HybB-like protein